MQAQSNIVVNDAAGVPVAHTFVAYGSKRVNDHTIAEYFERDALGKVGWSRVSIRHYPPKGKGGLDKYLFRLEKPILESASGTTADGYVPPEKLAYMPAFEAVVYAPIRATEQELADVFEMGTNVIRTAAVKSLVKYRETLTG